MVFHTAIPRYVTMHFLPDTVNVLSRHTGVWINEIINFINSEVIISFKLETV